MAVADITALVAPTAFSPSTPNLPSGRLPPPYPLAAKPRGGTDKGPGDSVQTQGTQAQPCSILPAGRYPFEGKELVIEAGDEAELVIESAPRKTLRTS
ncbi:hypothetical protein MK280_06020, partial [Myxococcota bacterium]|nr:hypothetical protein [Myxococcota bacterium]